MSWEASIVIGYFGDKQVWDPLVRRALASARNQTVKAEVIVSYQPQLHLARNLGAQRATTDLLIFLDADDELDSRYVEKMLESDADLRQPATLGIVDGREDPFPVVIPAKSLFEGNYMVIGTAVNRDVFLEAGMFRNLPAYEDWDLWLRCWLNGASIEACPEAIYRVHVRPASRNQMPREEEVALFNRIVNEYKGRTPRDKAWKDVK